MFLHLLCLTLHADVVVYQLFGTARCPCFSRISTNRQTLSSSGAPFFNWLPKSSLNRHVFNSYYAPIPGPVRPASNSIKERLQFPQVSMMVLPPPSGQGLPLEDFRKINRRFLMDPEHIKASRFDNLYQVSGIAQWKTPREYEPVLRAVLDDPTAFNLGERERSGISVFDGFALHCLSLTV